MLLYHVKTTYIEICWDFKSVAVFEFFAGFCQCLTLSCLPSILHELFECPKLTIEVQQDSEINLSFSEVLNSHTFHSSQVRDCFTFIVVLLVNIQQLHSRVSVFLLISDITSFST